MKWILICLIHLYWKIIPPSKRRHCIFSETCSVHVNRITYKDGIVAGIKALKQRIKQCRPGYIIFIEDGLFKLKFSNGDIMEEKDISKRILEAFQLSNPLTKLK